MEKLKKIIIGFFGGKFIGLILAFFNNRGSRLIIKKLHTLRSTPDFEGLQVKELAVFKVQYFYSSPRYISDVQMPVALNFYGELQNYVLSLNNVTLIGDSNLLLLNNDRKLVHFSNNYNETNARTIDSAIVTQLGKTSFLSVNSRIQNFENGINFVGYNSDNYYHFLYEILSKFENLQRLKLDIKLPLIFDAATKNVRQYQELITLFNDFNREILYVERNKLYHFNSLIHIATPNFIPSEFKQLQNIKAEDILFSSSSLKFLSESLQPMVSKKNYPAKLYLSRKIASNRRKFNEAEVESYLNSEGYFSLNSSDYSIYEQLLFFYNAEVIVGGSGAAFSNIFICKAHCKIICLSNYKLDISIFSTIASLKNLDLVYIIDKKLSFNKKSELHDHFQIDINDLKHYT